MFKINNVKTIYPKRTYKRNFSTIISIISILFILGFSGCKSNEPIITPEREFIESISRNQAAIAKLEIISGDLNKLYRGTQDKVEFIREQSYAIRDYTDRLIYLFGEYDTEVNRVLDEVERIRGELDEVREECQRLRDQVTEKE